MFANVPASKRKILVSFLAAGIGAILGEHFLKPKLKDALKV